MSVLNKTWQVYVGGSWVGTLTPTGADDTWVYATFSEGEAWGNFAPWFQQAAAAYGAGDETAWQETLSQLALMGISLAADDGESYSNPTLLIDGSSAWFAV